MPPAPAPTPTAPPGRARAEKTRRPPRAPRAGAEPILTGEGITVRFGGLVANDEISVSVRHGMVTGLIGPNGAGKTTFFNVLTGAQRPSEGRVLFDGHDVTSASRQAMAKRGAGRTFQNLALFENLTVRENVEVGAVRFAPYNALLGVLRTPSVRSQERVVQAIARRAIDFVGVADLADERVADIPYGDRRRVEFARALALGPRVLLLDEPSAGMDAVETRQLGEVISRVVDQLGIAVLLVEHDMSMVRDFVDYVYVLDFGRVVVDGSPEEALADERVVSAYLGTTEVR